MITTTESQGLTAGDRMRRHPASPFPDDHEVLRHVADRASVGRASRGILMPLALAQFICSVAGSNMNVMITDLGLSALLRRVGALRRSSETTLKPDDPRGAPRGNRRSA
jgi:hypothetical protein